MIDDNALILLCDDQLQALSIALVALENQGWEVIATQSPEACYQVATEMARTPDLILLDIVMPHMDGYELAKNLQAHHKTCAVPIIFVTGRKNSEEEEKGLALGAVDYVVKPFAHEVLRARVRNQLEIAKRRRMAVECECQRQRAIVETITDGVIILNREGVITGWSSQVAAICGYSEGEALGMRITSLMPPEVRALHEGLLADTFDGKRHELYGRRIRSRIMCKDDGFIPVEVSIGLARIGEEIAMTVRDLRQELEAVDDGRRRAHDAMAAMAISMAQQNVTPLAAARDRLKASGDAESMLIAESIEEIAEFYEFLSEADHDFNLVEPIDTKGCIDRAIMVCSEKWSKRMGPGGLTAHVPNLPQVLMHCYALDSILHGLICRACHACKTKGNPSAAKIVISARAEGDRVCIDVEDNGGRIADPDKIFDHSLKKISIKDGSPPLSICRNLARKYGGDLILKTNKQAGAVFEVWLPVGE